jgi:K+-transporting ATPase ATPase C chain
MLKHFGPAFRMTLFLTILTGLIYPVVITGICQALFKNKADGSLILRDGRIIGSQLIGQGFTKPRYFQPRPSAAGNNGYDATVSQGSNLGPTSRKLFERVKAAAEQFRKENPNFRGAIPADALTASGSGLDPEISVANAEAQSARVAAARGTSVDEVRALVARGTEKRRLGFLGEPRVNVLELNLALDRQWPVR